MHKIALAAALLVLPLALADRSDRAHLDGPPQVAPTSVLYGTRARATGGRLAVGLVLPRSDPKLLVDLVDKERLEAFLAKLNRGEVGEDEIEEVEGGGSAPEWGRSGALAKSAAELLRRGGVETSFHSIVADEVDGLPLVMVGRRRLVAGELRDLAAYAATGGTVFLGKTTRRQLQQLCPGGAIRTRGGGGDRPALLARRSAADIRRDADDQAGQLWHRLVAAMRNADARLRVELPDVLVVERGGRIVAAGIDRDGWGAKLWAKAAPRLIAELAAIALQSSPLVEVMDGPFGVRSAERNDVGFAAQLGLPASGRRPATLTAELVDLADRSVWRRRFVDDLPTELQVPFARELDPFTHRLRLTWRSGSRLLRQAHPIEPLVGSLDHRLRAAKRAPIGGTYAIAVEVVDSKSARPAAGQPVRATLRRGDARLVSAESAADGLGAAELLLAIPADVEPGVATLSVGDAELRVELFAAHRVHVVTDRSRYRPDDEVHARLLVHSFPTGRPVADREVEVALQDSQNKTVASRSVRTSAHGVAATTFALRDARGGKYQVRARVGPSRATCDLQVQAFELPRFELRVTPEAIRCRVDEAVPLRGVVRYLDGAPVVGAAVTVLGPEIRARVEAETDANGHFATEVAAGGRAESSAVRVLVVDADGRRASVDVPVIVVMPGAEIELLRTGPLIVGTATRFVVQARDRISGRPIAGRAQIEIIGESPRSTTLDANGRAEVRITPDARRLRVRVHVAAAADERPPAGQEFVFRAAPAQPSRPEVSVDNLVTEVGKPLHLRVRGPDGRATIDVLRDGVLVRTRTVEIVDGSAAVVLQLDPDLKGGFLPFDRDVPGDPSAYFEREFVDTGLIPADELISGCHSLAPRFLTDQIRKSQENLGLTTLDLYYLHNPEIQLEVASLGILTDRLRAAFEALAQARERGALATIGIATWSGLREPIGSPDHLSLERVAQLAEESGLELRAVQLPINVAMPEALARPTQPLGGDEGVVVPARVAASALGASLFASASILHGRLAAGGLPAEVRELFPNLTTDAQCALQFTRSAPGVTTALVGMSREVHVAENLAVAAIEPAGIEPYARMFGGG